MALGPFVSRSPCLASPLMRHLAFLFALLAAGASAQADYDQANQAFAEGRFEEAVRILEAAVAERPEDAETRYLYARVLHDERNPNRDVNEAGRQIAEAVELDPDNLVYLVAQLEQARADSPNLLVEIRRRAQRLSSARRILALDSTNAYAHEELGVQAIYDFYAFRNAIRLPGISRAGVDSFSDANQQADGASGLGAGSSGSNEAGFDPEALGGSEGYDDPAVGTSTVTGFDITAGESFFETELGAGFNNRFDVEGLALQGVAITDYSDRAQAAYSRAIGHLRTALASDPRRRAVYDHVVRLAVISGEYEQALPDLAEMYVQFPDDPGMWLYTGLVNHRLGQYQAADVAFRQALEKMTDADREVFVDLTLILPPDEHSAYRADPQAFADRYWTSRDPRFLNAVNERRTEHYARLTTAELLYRSDDLDRPGWESERGLLHVRYGVPDLDVVIEGGYGEVVERFVGRNAAFRPADMVQAANRFNVWTYADGMTMVFEDPDRSGRFTLYSPPADAFGATTQGRARDVSRMDFVERVQEEVRERPERYQFKAPGRAVELPYRVTAFKGDEGQTDLYVNFGVPVGDAGPAQSGVRPDVDVTIRTGAFLVGPQRDLLVERRRTVYGLRGAQIVPFSATNLWTSTEAMTADPADGYEVSLEFETASGQTSAVQRRALDVPSFAGGGLRLSDVLLAYYVEEADRPEPGRVFRDGISIQPAPWGVFPVDDPIYLYVEAYGLGLADGRSDYEVEASLKPKDTSGGVRRLARRIFGGDGTAVSSAFEVQGDREDDPVYLFLDASGQDTGLYTLTVTVRDRVTGAEAQEETDLYLE